MKVIFRLIIFFVLCSSAVFSQTDSVYYGSPTPVDSVKRKKASDYEWVKKLTYEGNLQLQLGTYTFIYFSPTIGFSPVKKVNLGLGVIYNYISINYGAPYGKVSQSVFGGHSYVRYFINEGFFLQGQYDRLRQPNVYSFNGDQKRWVDYLLVGGGFRRPIGDKIGLSGTLLYNLTPDRLSIYPNRLILQFGLMGSF